MHLLVGGADIHHSIHHSGRGYYSRSYSSQVNGPQLGAGVGVQRIYLAIVKQGAILAEFPRLALKNGLKECLCNIARRKPESTFDNIVRDFGVRYVEGYTSPNFADVVANAPFSE
jgi:hypothetical protein